MRISGWKRKAPVLTILAFFVGAGIIPSTMGTNEQKTTLRNSYSGGYTQQPINSSYSIFQIPMRYTCE